jgi:hypothetical protein
MESALLTQLHPSIPGAQEAARRFDELLVGISHHLLKLGGTDHSPVSL